MTYYGSRPGFTEGGMGAAFAVSTTPSEGLRSIQRDLQRMGLLAAGSGATGADGLWGPRTAAAVTQAASRVGRTAAPFSTSNAGRLITIPDDFIAAIQAAASPAAVIATLPMGPMESGTMAEPSAFSTTLSPPPVEDALPARTRMYLIGGSLAAIGTIAGIYFLWPKSSTPNRRRRARRYGRR